jgi:hypothetical protein
MNLKMMSAAVAGVATMIAAGCASESTSDTGTSQDEISLSECVSAAGTDPKQLRKCVSRCAEIADDLKKACREKVKDLPKRSPERFETFLKCLLDGSGETPPDADADGGTPPPPPPSQTDAGTPPPPPSQADAGPAATSCPSYILDARGEYVCTVNKKWCKLDNISIAVTEVNGVKSCEFSGSGKDDPESCNNLCK